MKDNIILIGMPGVGKSSAGVVLAKVLGYEFIDSDLVIQKATGELLKDIIAERGNKGFLEVENRINAGIEASHAVIATGGSVVKGILRYDKFTARQSCRTWRSHREGPDIA